MKASGKKQAPRTRIVEGVPFTEGEVFVIKGVGWLIAHFCKRGMQLRKWKGKI